MWNITTKFHQNSLITVTIPIYSSQKIFTKLLTYSQHHQNQKKILLSNILVFLIKKISFKFSINFITKTHIKFFYPKKNSPEIIKKIATISTWYWPYTFLNGLLYASIAVLIIIILRFMLCNSRSSPQNEKIKKILLWKLSSA